MALGGCYYFFPGINVCWAKSPQKVLGTLEMAIFRLEMRFLNVFFSQLIGPVCGKGRDSLTWEGRKVRIEE